MPDPVSTTTARKAADLLELAGGLHTAASIAVTLGVSREAVRLMAQRPEFPRPVVAHSSSQTRRVTMWIMEEVKEWAAMYRPTEE